jgi:hypothetical protein
VEAFTLIGKAAAKSKLTARDNIIKLVTTPARNLEYRQLTILPSDGNWLQRISAV